MTLTVLELTGPNPSRTFLGAGALTELEPLVQGHDVAALIVDEHVAELHGAGFEGRFSAVHRVPRGEACKDFAHLQAALAFCAGAGLSRRSLLVTLGGGATSDLGGLTAALFKRGLDVVHVPTTIVGQVDAAIGGKTAIDLPQGKNLVGAFHMPTAVLCEPRFLETLPDVEFRAGLGEVLKSALIEGPEALAALEDEATALADRSPEATERAIAMAAGLKTKVVSEDPLERGPRRALNLGHTFGHALETVAGHGVVAHGLAVAAGIGLALQASKALGMLEDESLPERVASLSKTLGLPTSVQDLRTTRTALDPIALGEAMAHDKKGSVGAPEFVLPRAAGRIDLGVRLEPSLVLELCR